MMEYYKLFTEEENNHCTTHQSPSSLVKTGLEQDSTVDMSGAMRIALASQGQELVTQILWR